jgi:hypothetical protein
MFKQKASVLLALLVVGMSSGALAPPVATSYKSTASVTSLSFGTNTCPTGQFPIAVSGTGTDLFGDYTLTEQMCADPVSGGFAGTFKIAHAGAGSLIGKFNGTFFPSGQIFEVHATWTITSGTGEFSHAVGAGTGKGVAMAVNGGPGPGNLLLDGSIVVPSE